MPELPAGWVGRGCFGFRLALKLSWMLGLSWMPELAADGIDGCDKFLQGVIDILILDLGYTDTVRLDAF